MTIPQIAWCENDYQLDIALPEDRKTYKRIIDRAAEIGLTHILFAPRNSDVSSRANNTDPWGWEQLLWFGYGQRLRMGLWSPGDPLADSLQEMLDYFKLKGVKPVAYVYPILAFLAGTLPGGGSPPWIVTGTYMSGSLSAEPAVGLGSILRSNLANEEFIKWLPETMVDFAQQTGAGGFSFDLTYWEEGPFAMPVEMCACVYVQLGLCFLLVCVRTYIACMCTCVCDAIWLYMRDKMYSTVCMCELLMLPSTCDNNKHSLIPLTTHLITATTVRSTSRICVRAVGRLAPHSFATAHETRGESLRRVKVCGGQPASQPRMGGVDVGTGGHIRGASDV